MTTKREKLKSVLLIDDSEIDIFINRKILERCGATSIQTFTNTLTALQYLTQTSDIPQLILLDIYFPEMDGFEFLDKFKKLEIARHPIDTFILSGSFNPKDIEKTKQKCSGFIPKMLTKEKLFAQLETLDKTTLEDLDDTKIDK